MFNPRWLHNGEKESKICYTQEEYDARWAEGWRGSPDEVPDPKLAYLEFLDEIAAMPEVEPEPEPIPEPEPEPIAPIPEPGPALPFKRGPGRPPMRRY